MADSASGRENVEYLDLSTHLGRQIIEMIRRDGLKRGDRLPSVRVLAEEFSVAQPTMRNALGRLQANGVVNIRHGSGIYVLNDRERIVIANPNHGDIDADTLLQLLDARLLIEPHLARSAALRITPDEIEEMERLLEGASRWLDGSSDKDLHRANWDFHRAVAKFSSNRILAQTIESLLEIYSFEQLVLISFYDDRPRDHREHVEIFEAIRNRDVEKAYEKMRRHLWDVKAVVESRQSQSD